MKKINRFRFSEMKTACTLNSKTHVTIPIFILAIFQILIFSRCAKDVPIDCIPYNLSGSVVAFYDFSGGSLNDKSGDNHNLKNTNDVIFGPDRAGNAMCAARFDKTKNQFLSTDGNFTNNLQNKSLSISLWYKPEPAVKGYELLVGRSDTDKLKCPSKFGEWSIGLYDCRRPVAGIHKNEVWAKFDPIWSDNSVEGLNKCEIERQNYTKAWKHLVFTYQNNVRECI